MYVHRKPTIECLFSSLLLVFLLRCPSTGEQISIPGCKGTIEDSEQGELGTYETVEMTEALVNIDDDTFKTVSKQNKIKLTKPKEQEHQ